jgi:uncharacterized membrane protein YhhN
VAKRRLERRRVLIPFLPYAIISIVHCMLIIFKLPGSGFETKQLLMPALALAAVWSMWRVRPWQRSAMVLLLVALTASWIGDGAGLFFASLPTLPTMIGFFAIAHLAYIVLFWRAPGIAEPKRVPWWALVYTVWWVVTLVVVGPHAGALFAPLAIYGVVLGLTAALSTRFGRLVACGGAFFLVSDTFIALKEFMGVPAWLGDLVIMPTYTLGQGLIVFGTVILLRRRARSFGSIDS